MKYSTFYDILYLKNVLGVLFQYHAVTVIKKMKVDVNLNINSVLQYTILSFP